MGKPNLSAFASSVRKSVVKHSPEILTGMGIAGMIASTVLAVKATPKALHLLEEAALEKDAYVHELTVPEKVKACWKCYIPATVTGVTSIACLIGASTVSSKRNAALAAAYTLTDSALREYQDKVVETIGEKKEQLVRDKVAEERIKNNPISTTTNEVVITDKTGDLCFDVWSSRYFKSDIEKLRKAENEVNRMMLEDGSVSLNDFYYEVGLQETKIGYDLGWEYGRDGFVKLQLSSQLDENGTPCIVLDFRIAPRYGYDR